MSSEQYSDTPMPDLKPCPQCGAMMPASAKMCALCAEKHAIQEGLPPPNKQGGTSPGLNADPPVPGFPWAVFCVAGALLCVGIAVAFGVAGALVLLAVFVTPALIRIMVAASQSQDETRVQIAPSFTHLFFSSLGASVLVGIAASVAFCAVCSLVGFGLLATTDRFGDGTLNLSFILGGVAGVAVALWLFRRLWSKKD